MKRPPILLFFLFITSCSIAPPPAAKAPVHVVIVGTTDVHGWFNGHTAPPPYGGLAILSSYIDALRAANPGHVVVVDSTDPVAAATNEAKRLRGDGADAVIVIAHMGGRCTDMNDVNDVASCEKDQEAMRFLQALPPGLIDAYFAGHTHSQMRQVVNGVPTTQALAYSHSFSTVDLWVDHTAHKVTKSVIRPSTMLCAQGYEGTETCDPRQAP